MAAATSTAIAGGGILSSSDFIGSIMRPNVVVNVGSILPVRSRLRVRRAAVIVDCSFF